MSITSDECRAKAADWYLAPGEIRNALEAAADALDAANAELANVKMGCAELDRQLADAQHWRERHCRDSAAGRRAVSGELATAPGRAGEGG